MKQFLNSLLTLGLFILAAMLFFVGVTYTFPSSLINIVLFIVAIFVLLQGCGNIDKQNGYGKYSATTSADKDETQIKDE